jgi:hypothetical protein
MAKIGVELTTGRDYAIAGVALVIIVLALLFTANSIRTTVTTAIG